MKRTWPATPLTVLTPIRPGSEQDLGAYICRLPRGEDSPFRRLSSTHFARWVIIDKLASDFPGAPFPPRPLQMQYLLFSSTFNSRVNDYIEELRTELGDVADGVWGNCVGYPGHARQAEFRRYFSRNTLPTRQWYAAYDESVEEVRAALKLREQHLAFAREVQGRPDDDERLHRDFKKLFRCAS